MIKPCVEVKLGSTSNPIKRFETFATGRPEWTPIFIWWSDCGGGQIIERELIKYYRTALVTGEIFSLPPAEIGWLITKPSEFFISSGMFDWLKEFDWKQKWAAVPRKGYKLDLHPGGRSLEDYFWDFIESVKEKTWASRQG
jgi:hypothetical protein